MFIPPNYHDNYKYKKNIIEGDKEMQSIINNIIYVIKISYGYIQEQIGRREGRICPRRQHKLPIKIVVERYLLVRKLEKGLEIGSTWVKWLDLIKKLLGTRTMKVRMLCILCDQV